MKSRNFARPPACLRRCNWKSCSTLLESIFEFEVVLSPSFRATRLRSEVFQCCSTNPVLSCFSSQCSLMSRTYLRHNVSGYAPACAVRFTYTAPFSGGLDFYFAFEPYLMTVMITPLTKRFQPWNGRDKSGRFLVFLTVFAHIKVNEVVRTATKGFD